MTAGPYPPPEHLLGDLGMEAELTTAETARVRTRATPFVAAPDGGVRAEGVCGSLAKRSAREAAAGAGAAGPVEKVSGGEREITLMPAPAAMSCHSCTGCPGGVAGCVSLRRPAPRESRPAAPARTRPRTRRPLSER